MGSTRPPNFGKLSLGLFGPFADGNALWASLNFFVGRRALEWLYNASLAEDPHYGCM